MKINNIVERYWYILLIIIILFSLISSNLKQESITGSVILNLHKQENNYEIENPSNININLTIKSQNKISESLIIKPNQTFTTNKDDFDAIGEQYE